MNKYKTVDEYLSNFSGETRKKLDEIRKTIKKLLPEGVTEEITYGIPTFKLNGKYVVYFAGYERHVSIYPIPHSLDPELEKAITPYVAGRGTLRFALDKPLPLDLIKQITLLHLERTRG